MTRITMISASPMLNLRIAWVPSLTVFHSLSVSFATPATPLQQTVFAQRFGETIAHKHQQKTHE